MVFLKVKIFEKVWRCHTIVIGSLCNRGKKYRRTMDEKKKNNKFRVKKLILYYYYSNWFYLFLYVIEWLKKFKIFENVKEWLYFLFFYKVSPTWENHLLVFFHSLLL